MELSYYKNKFFINIGVILLLFSLIMAFIIYPVLSEISKVNKEITNERIKLETKLAMGLNIKKIIQDLEEIEKPAEQLDNIFIEKGKELEFVNELELIALKSNVDLLLNSDFTGEIIDAGVSQVDIQATITGTYKQILEFIHSTESMDRYFNIKLITLSKNRSGDSNIVAQISGNTYFK